VNYLSKKLIGILASSVAVFIVITWLLLPDHIFTFHPTTKKPTTSNLTQTDQEHAADTKKDSDGDGIEDWKEILWNTNPYTADTDGDGITDDREVAERQKTGESLSTVGETRLIRDIVIESFPQGDIPADPDSNISERAIENYVNGYLTSAYNEVRTGEKIDVEQLSQMLLSELKQEIMQAQKPSQDTFAAKNEITVISDPSPEIIRNYLNELGMVFLAADGPTTPAYQIIQRVIGIVGEDAEVDYTEIRQLREHSLLYLSFGTRMREMAVPEHLVDAHVDMMNSFVRISIILEDIMRVEFDPLKGFTAAVAYFTEVEESKKPLAVFVAAVRENNFYFELTEGGIVFAQHAAKL
jgi:hypothetical protein